MGERRERVKSRNMYNGPMDKDNLAGRIECGRAGQCSEEQWEKNGDNNKKI